MITRQKHTKEDRRISIIALMNDVYNKFKNGYVELKNSLVVVEKGKKMPLYEKHHLSAFYTTTPFIQKGFIDVETINGVRCGKWIGRKPTEKDYEKLYVAEVEDRELRAEKNLEFQPEEKVEVAKVEKYSIPRVKTVYVTFKYMSVIYFNTKGAWVAKKDVLKFTEFNKSGELVTVKMSDVYKRDKHLSIKVLITLGYLEEKDNKVHWIGPKPTYQLANDVCVHINKLKAPKLVIEAKKVKIEPKIAPVEEVKNDFQKAVLEIPGEIDFNSMTENERSIYQCKKLGEIAEVLKANSTNTLVLTDLFGKAISNNK